MTKPRTEPSSVHNVFSLNKISGVVDSYQTPEAAFDPVGDWTQTWHICTILTENGFAPEGELTLTRAAKPDGGATLEIRAFRNGRSGFAYRIHARLECAADALATPSAWTFSSKMARTNDEAPYLDSGLTKTARVENETLILTSGADVKRAPLADAYTCKWCLLDAVQRLPRAETQPIGFSLLDEFDQIHTNQRLAFRKNVTLEMAGVATPLTGYEHLGPGVIPTVYWVDAAGRALFVTTGQEAYVLKSSNGAASKHEWAYPLREMRQD